MFEHSVKVPRHYKIAANIFKKVATEGGSVKNLLYDDKLKHFRTNVLFALITETIKHAKDIDKIFENSGILAKEQRLDPWLAKILTAELLFGKKSLPGKSKPEQTILSYKEQFENFRSENPDEVKSKVVHRPRYVRINTNLLTTSDAIRAFQDEGYKFIRCTSGSYDDYLKQIQSLTEYDFTQDYHVKTVFVFAPGTKFHDYDLYLNNQIILQDKATALAVHLLAPPTGSTVLDMCAAPGMKTTQVAAYLRNQGKVYAVERNDKRFETLCQLVESTSSKCVQTIHKDVLTIRRGDLDYVEYILLDPSCSGSGMDFSLHNYIEDTRLAKLTSLQEKFLKHAMNAFPNAKRIVYSTCSVFPEENERVVTNVVKTSRAKWRVQDVKELMKGQWNNFGSGMYGSMGTRCLYSKPDSDMTTGFFLAVLDRDQKAIDEDKKTVIFGKKHKAEISKGNVDSEPEETVKEDVNEIIVKKKKDKNLSENVTEMESNSAKSEILIKTKDKSEEFSYEKVDPEPQEIVEEVTDAIAKKKKKKDKNLSENDTEMESCSAKSDILIKTKNKSEEFSNEKVDPEPQEIVEEVTDAIVKKKKKKDKNLSENDTEMESSSAKTDILIKTKNKSEEFSDEKVDPEPQEIIEVADVIVKKKKKKDKNLSENDTEMESCSAKSDTLIKTKDKSEEFSNEKVDPEPQEIVEEVTDAIVKKKKIKDKNLSENDTEMESSSAKSDILIKTKDKSEEFSNEKVDPEPQEIVKEVADVIVKKKKKKDKNRLENDTEMEFSSAKSDILIKTKDKSEEFPNDKVNPEPQEIVEEVADVIVKNKKKKDKNRSENESEIKQDVTEMESNLTQSDISIKAKKHKKSKSKDDIIESEVIGQNGTGEVVLEEKKNKKCPEENKSLQNQQYVTEEEPLNETEEYIETNNSKKRKRNKKCPEEKKSLQNQQDVTEEEPLNETEEYIETNNSKKRKRSRHSEHNNTDDGYVKQNLKAEEKILEEPLKKKKNKNSSEDSTVDSEISLSDIMDILKEQKKRKKQQLDK